MIDTLVLFVIGFFILIKGADFLIDGATSVAKRFNISNWIIGMTVVGIGTSIPEFSITLLSALGGEADIGLGTIIGSNTFNILLILGLSAAVFPLTAKPVWITKDLVMNIYAVLAAAVLAIFPLIGGGFFEISKGEGFVLLFLFIAWMFYLVVRNGATKRLESEEGPSLKIFAIPLSVLMMIGGLVGVIIGAEWVVRGGELLARAFGTSEAIIGLTVIGIGTSLPELTVSVSAARKGNVGISLGNIVGSNIFDFLGILGIAAAVRSVAFPRELVTDLMITLGAAVLLLLAMFVPGEGPVRSRVSVGRSKYTLERWQGFVFIALYILYISMIGKI
ncbi:MAG TPA: calcium/sodium antiporter [Candidatus Paceibacterota bacterium]|nr:calcium/sodium antiporter [Candidatus Paceibacterota bacterium]